MAEIYRFVLPDGQEHDWHRGLDALRLEHPHARIVGHRVTDALGQGRYEPYVAPRPAARERPEVKPVSVASEPVKPAKKGA